MNKALEYTLKIGGPILLLAAGGGLAAFLIMNREPPSRGQRQSKQAAVVETATAKRAQRRLRVQAQGEVIPTEEVTLRPRVAGELVYVAPELEPGALIERGEVLARVDPTNYRLALEQRRAQLDQARAQLTQEQGRQRVAANEWESFKDEIPAEARDPKLAQRQPQLDRARANVAMQESMVERAKKDLRRTRVRAPFDGVIRQEFVGEGDVVGTQSRVATLARTDAFWVRATIPLEELGQVAIPGVNATEGAEVTISQDVGKEPHTWTGRTERLQAGLDPQSRMARVLIRVEDPLALQGREDEDKPRGLPLLLDSYVEVDIPGDSTRELVEVPQEAVRGDEEVWVFDDGELDIRPVEIATRRPETVLLSAGLEPGARVVTSGLASPVEGMALERASTAQDDEENQTAMKASGEQPQGAQEDPTDG